MANHTQTITNLLRGRRLPVKRLCREILIEATDESDPALIIAKLQEYIAPLQAMQERIREGMAPEGTIYLDSRKAQAI